jgi:hypothetical protein
MSEKKLLIDEDEITYEGLFDMKELYALIDDYLKFKGYDKFEPKNDESVYAGGKNIQIILTPAKWHTDYVKKIMKIELLVTDMKDIETEIDKVKVTVNQGKVSIKFSGILETDWEGRWEQRPLYLFFRTLFEKFVYKGEMKRFEDEIIADVKELKAKVGSYLNLNRFKKAI